MSIVSELESQLAAARVAGERPIRWVLPPDAVHELIRGSGAHDSIVIAKGEVRFHEVPISVADDVEPRLEVAQA